MSIFEEVKGTNGKENSYGQVNMISYNETQQES